MKKWVVLAGSIFIDFLCAAEIVYNSPLLNDSRTIVKATTTSFLVVFFLLLFLFFWYKKILPGIQGVQTGNIKIVDKLLLDPTTAVYLLEINNIYQLLVTSNKNVTLLGNFSKKELQLKTSPLQPGVKKTFPAQLEYLLKKTGWNKTALARLYQSKLKLPKRTDPDEN